MNLTKSLILVALFSGMTTACLPSVEGPHASAELAQDQSPLILENRIYEVTKSSKDLEAFKKHYDHGGLIFLKYGATWCPPCRQFNSTVMSKLKLHAFDDQVMIADVDIDALKKLPREWRAFFEELKSANTIPNATILVDGKRARSLKSLGSGDREVTRLRQIFAQFPKAGPQTAESIVQTKDSPIPVVQPDLVTEQKIKRVTLGGTQFEVKRDPQSDEPRSLVALFVRIIHLHAEPTFEVDGKKYEVRKNTQNVVIGLKECNEGTCRIIAL